MVISVIALIIGALLAVAGIYYLAKEKGDAETRKIYAVTLALGLIVLAGALVKLFVFG